jgi:peptidase M1-like protein
MCPQRSYSHLIPGLVLALSFPLSLFAEEKPVPVTYDLKVAIEPAAGKIAVQGKMLIPREKSSAGDLKFALHETFTVNKLTVNGHPAHFSFQPAAPNPLNPATRNVIVALPDNFADDKVHLEIAYEGQLKKLPEFGAAGEQELSLDDQINTRLVELANYSTWYPQFGVFGHPIDIEMEVSLPQGWTAICSGKKVDENVKDGRAITRWSSPKDFDILITAAPNYKQRVAHVGNAQIEIYYTQLPEAFIENEVHQLADTLKLYTGRLGEATIPAGTVKQVYSPKHNGQGRAGISRPGMIVTSEGVTLKALAEDPKFSLFQDVAHEVAHFWWNFGAGQGDWINEAFAEYYSALAVENVISKEQFESVLENYRHEVHELPADAPPLATVPFDGSGFVIRYYKGSLMLDHLRRMLGDDRFFQASKDFFHTYEGKSIGTTEFRNFWSERLGERKNELGVWLDSPGGLPKTSSAGK